MPSSVHRQFLFATFCGTLLLPLARADQTLHVPLTADHWKPVASTASDPATEASFFSREGFPQGVLLLKAGSVALNGLTFRNGTLEFDLKPIGEDMPGIRFHRSGDSGEEFYIRSSPDCRASDDCLQYAPVLHGFMLWNTSPQYQTAAPVLDGWNHVKLVISGQRMNVYINHSSQPSLEVGQLAAGTADGALELFGPAVFTNLTVTPDAVEGLPATPTPDPTANDPGLVRHWTMSRLTPWRFGHDPTYAEAPTDPATWTAIAAERFGLVNLTRLYKPLDGPPTLEWLRFHVQSTRAQTKHVSLGWIGQTWIFANGHALTRGKNFYYPEYERRNPDGRLSLQNGSFDMPLQPGDNEITIALYGSLRDNNKGVIHYGWGVAMRFDDAHEIKLLAR